MSTKSIPVDIPEYPDSVYEYDYDLLGEPITGININHLIVNKEFRRQGIATSIIEQLIAGARSKYNIEYAVINIGRKTNDETGVVSYLQSNEFNIVEKSADHITAEKEI